MPDRLRVDDNFDGIGTDSALAMAAQSFSAPIAGTGSTLDFRIRVPGGAVLFKHDLQMVAATDGLNSGFFFTGFSESPSIDDVGTIAFVCQQPAGGVKAFPTPLASLNWEHSMLKLVRTVLDTIAAVFIVVGVVQPVYGAVATSSSHQFGTLNWDTATATALDASGNAYVAGYDNVVDPTGTPRNASLRKYDSAGAFLWQREFGTAADESVWSLTTDIVGNVYVGGQTMGDLAAVHLGGGDSFIRKYGPSGDVLWTRQFGTAGFDVTFGLATNSTGDLFASGNSSVRRYDALGNLLWSSPFSSEYAFGIAVDSLGNVFVGGSGDHEDTGVDFDAFLTKFNLAGERSWTQWVSSTAIDEGFDVAVDNLGNAFLVGTTNGDLAGPNNGAGLGVGSNDIFISKFDEAGNQAWIRQIGGVFGEEAEGVASDFSGGAYMVGYGNSGSNIGGAPFGGQDTFVCQFDADGNLVWSTRIGTDKHEPGRGIATNASGQIAVAGSTSGNLYGTNAGVTDGWLLVLRNTEAGDFNNDGTVDAADYIVWRKNDGTSEGYNTWRANFGMTNGLGSASSANANAAVPEPSTLVMLIVLAGGIRLRRRHLGSRVPSTR